VKGWLTRAEGAGIAAVGYVLVLGAHMELPELGPFALFLLTAVPLTAALAMLASVSRGRVPRRPRERGRSGRRPSPEGPPRCVDIAWRRGRANRASSGVVSARGTGSSGESSGLEAMRAALARLEGELHALEDQRLTELACMNGDAR